MSLYLHIDMIDLSPAILHMKPRHCPTRTPNNLRLCIMACCTDAFCSNDRHDAKDGIAGSELIAPSTTEKESEELFAGLALEENMGEVRLGYLSTIT